MNGLLATINGFDAASQRYEIKIEPISPTSSVGPAFGEVSRLFLKAANATGLASNMNKTCFFALSLYIYLLIYIYIYIYKDRG